MPCAVAGRRGSAGYTWGGEAAAQGARRGEGLMKCLWEGVMVQAGRAEGRYTLQKGRGCKIGGVEALGRDTVC